VSEVERQLAGGRDDELPAALLGAWARMRRSPRLFADRAPAGTPPAAGDDPLVLATLGWLSLRRHLARRLAEAAPPLDREGLGATAPRSRPGRRRGLLR
jgi:hypothetical protein